MPIYLAIPLKPESAELDTAVEKHILAPDRFKLQADRGWFIKFDGTSVELSNALGITGQPPGEKSPVGSAMVTPISTYFGRGPTDMWEWIKTRLEE